ncbi:MAG: hypothetical protein CMN02_14380 [Roseibacillus sp.]|nr:hypothetical protein [Roseibacillus sp.]MBB82148.1 hypothetical protein [Roseibacillus sp.]|tara:strand:+ start:1032 stop:1250 length:219 start_codon:yes stop_codon:yes gene_type:complete
MNQRFAKDVYRQSGTNDSPMKHSVAEGRSREEGSKLVWNWGVYFKAVRVLYWITGLAIGIALIVAIIIKSSQ